MAIALRLAANVSASHPRNGPFSFQQWSILILTMVHCLDGCHFDSRLMSAGFSQCCTRGYRLPWAQIHGSGISVVLLNVRHFKITMPLNARFHCPTAQLSTNNHQLTTARKGSIHHSSFVIYHWQSPPSRFSNTVGSFTPCVDATDFALALSV